MDTDTEKKIMVVDDDSALRRLISQVLIQNSYCVIEAGGGQEALRTMFAEKPDLVLLDVVMAGMDGWQTCSRIRDISDVPIIMLTGKMNTEEDIVRGLDSGADEYLLKPVGNRELVARVRAALRRAESPSYQEKKGKVSFKDDYLTIDIAERKVLVRGEKIKLTPREFRLLALLLENAGTIVTHRQILEKVWGWEYIDDVDYVRIYISHLRQKLESEADQPQYILTESGAGYYFRKTG
ncbi:MAG: response regulator transcription factor [Dehalococcoidales bacterium]|nr:response regulator transcription factor [Dehalococcoidales bacterium]